MPVTLASAALLTVVALRAAGQADPPGEKGEVAPAEKKAAPKAVKIQPGVDILKVRNFFARDGQIVVTEPAKKVEPIAVVPAADPADNFVLTGIIRLGDSWMAVLEEIPVRKGQFVAVGETVPGLPQWQIEAVNHERESVRFRNRGAPVDVALGGSLTGRNAAALEKALAAGRSVGASAVGALPAGAGSSGTTAVATGSSKGRDPREKGRREPGKTEAVEKPAVAITPSTVPLSGMPTGGPPAGGPETEERINRKSGITEEDARFLEQYLPERDVKSVRPGR
jgi:hypothetical protein